MTEATTDALQQMARHVATQLVVDALKDMVANVPSLPVTVTLHPQRLLPPAPVEKKRRGRKPGPKPKLRKSQREVDKSEGSSSSGRTRVSKTRNAGSSPAEPATEVSSRRCRKCMKLGSAQQVSAKELRCTSCGHRWQLRLKADERRAAPSTKTDDRCVRCDHTAAEHDANDADRKCLSYRCSCTGFYR